MKKEVLHIFGEKYFLLGVKNKTKYYLCAPSWDCGWYWGLGYVNTFNRTKTDIYSHDHFNHLILHGENESGEMIYHINKFLDESVLTEAESWELSDLLKSCYELAAVAEIFYRGKNNMGPTTVNLKDENLYNKINKKLLPKLFKRIEEILS